MFGRPGMDDRVEQVVDITQVCLEKQTLRNIVSFLAIFPSHFPQKEQFLFKAFIDFLSLILVYDSVHYRISRPGRQSEH